jgi:hypothetical protein
MSAAPEYLWHVLTDPFAPRRCRHRVLLESGAFYVASATCRSIPDPSEDWKGRAFKVEQVQKRAVDTGGKWTTVRPPLPPKQPRPPRPEPWSYSSIPPENIATLHFVVDTSADATVLGLVYPFTGQDVRGAFRRKVKTAHPDKGGSQDEFIRLRAAHDHLLDALRRRSAA